MITRHFDHCLYLSQVACGVLLWVPAWVMAEQSEPLTGSSSSVGVSTKAAATAPSVELGAGQIFDTFLGLILVLALMLGLAWLVKRYLHTPGVGKGQIHVVGGVSLGPRERAVIVEVDGERLLLGVAQGQVRMLHKLADDAPAASDFSDELSDAQMKTSVETSA